MYFTKEETVIKFGCAEDADFRMPRKHHLSQETNDNK